MESLSLNQFDTLPVAVELTKATEKLTDFKEQRHEVEKQIDEINRNLSNPGRNRMAAEIDALLTGSKSPPVEDEEITRRDTGKLYHRRRVLDEAIKHQERTIAELRSKYSKQVCEKLRPQAVKIVSRITKTLEELSAALDEEKTFFEDLQANEISFTSWMPRANFRGVGSLKDEYSNVRLFFKQLREDYPEVEVKLPDARPIRSDGTMPRLVVGGR